MIEDGAYFKGSIEIGQVPEKRIIFFFLIQAAARFRVSTIGARGAGVGQKRSNCRSHPKFFPKDGAPWGKRGRRLFYPQLTPALLINLTKFSTDS